MAQQRLCHPDGELAMARAAAACGLPYVLSTMATASIQVREAVGRGLGQASGPGMRRTIVADALACTFVVAGWPFRASFYAQIDFSPRLSARPPTCGEQEVSDAVAAPSPAGGAPEDAAWDPNLWFQVRESAPCQPMHASSAQRRHFVALQSQALPDVQPGHTDRLLAQAFLLARRRSTC